jgi:hypothetical protein
LLPKKVEATMIQQYIKTYVFICWMQVLRFLQMFLRMELIW